MKERCDRDRARVDHRVEWAIRHCLQLNRIKRLAARLDSNVPEYFVTSEFLDRDAERKRFGYRLDRERTIAVPSLKNPSIRCHETDAQLIRVGFFQFRDVCRYSPFV